MESEAAYCKATKEAAGIRKLAASIGKPATAADILRDEIKLLRSCLKIVGRNTFLFVGVDNDRKATVALYSYMARLCWDLAEKAGYDNREDIRANILQEYGECQPGH